MFLEQGVQGALGLGPVGFVILLIVVGLLALGVELFVIPGFGLAGIVGIAALAGGCIAAWVQLGPLWGVVTVAGTLLVSTWLVAVVLRRLVLRTKLGRGGGTASADLESLVGSRGETGSDLRPAGIAIVDGRRVDVVSEGGFIEKGTKIKVIAVDGPRVVVAPAE